MNVYGVEFDEDRIESLRSEGFNIIAGGATVAINVYAGAGEEIAKAFRANTATRDATP
ncbi:hypothetical protein CRES_0365 [Corynebacterium resistens DSM 45100]|uniref:Uncharacterized protein n=1 Tax=Corynebacterium resistens (strain DSM 45100 / JCM 12819 / GTC 2026 / SICGH 158) TaxID=662755 RepID=F8DXI3_CORRG|nr:hypothetical protein CRES_0365 [Corynebacterium resistens DSM 45100]